MKRFLIICVFFSYVSENCYCSEYLQSNEYFVIDPVDEKNMGRYRLPTYLGFLNECDDAKITLKFTDNTEIKVLIIAHHLAGNMKHIADMRWSKDYPEVPEYYKLIHSKYRDNLENGIQRKKDFNEMALILREWSNIYGFSQDANALLEGGLSNSNFINQRNDKIGSFYIKIKKVNDKFKKYRDQRKIKFWDYWRHPIRLYEFETINSDNVNNTSNGRLSDDKVLFGKNVMPRRDARKALKKGGYLF